MAKATHEGRADELGLAKRILVGIVIGGALGHLAYGTPGSADLVRLFTQPLGTIWLRLLLVMMLPLASAAVFLGVLELEPREIGRIGARAFGLTIGLTAIAVAVGLVCVAIVQPGVGIDPDSLPSHDFGGVEPPGDPVSLVIAQVPSNIVSAASGDNLLPVLVFAALFGVALRKTPTDGAQAIRRVAEGVFDVSARAVRMVLYLAPLGVAALTFSMAARGGIDALMPVARFAGVVLLALSLQMLIVYPLVLRVAAKRSPLSFFRAIRPAMAVAFSTASSAATLPTTLSVSEKTLGLRKESARFVLTVGATVNQNGTALFEGLAVVFFAQLYGVPLGVLEQVAILGIAIVAGIGTAGVPAGSLPVITALIVNLGIPAHAIGIIVGVDRLLDMARTTLNVTGDLVIASVVAPPEPVREGADDKGVP